MQAENETLYSRIYKLKDRFLKFLFVGGLFTILNYAIFYILFRFFGVHYIIASAIGYITGLVLGYFVNKLWTYQVSKDSEESYAFMYLLVYMVSLAAGSFFLKVLVDYLHINELISNIFSIGLSTIMNFLGTNFLVFKDSSK
jgi:putative flippase GtrA